jgi:hypothetical protein
MRVLASFMLGMIVVSVLIAAGTETAEREPIHQDVKMTERAALKVIRAFLRDDAGDLLNWLRMMEQQIRPLDHERDGDYDQEIVSHSQSFHGTLERTRQLVAAGNIDKAFEQYKWTQRSCIDCHRKARDAGLIVVPD